MVTEEGGEPKNFNFSEIDRSIVTMTSDKRCERVFLRGERKSLHFRFARSGNALR